MDNVVTVQVLDPEHDLDKVIPRNRLLEGLDLFVNLDIDDPSIAARGGCSASSGSAYIVRGADKTHGQYSKTI